MQVDPFKWEMNLFNLKFSGTFSFRINSWDLSQVMGIEIWHAPLWDTVHWPLKNHNVRMDVPSLFSLTELCS